MLTPNSSLTNVTSLANGDTTRSLLAGHDGLTTNINNTTHTLSPSASVNNTLPIIDPLHGLLLGNTTAFDAETIQQQKHCTHISPSQQQQAAVTTTTSPSTRMNDLFQTKGNTEKDSASLLINGRFHTYYPVKEQLDIIFNQYLPVRIRNTNAGFFALYPADMLKKTYFF